jgi:hypothetical protein
MIARSLELALRSVLAPGVVAGRLVDRVVSDVDDDGPVAPASLALAAKIALDELFFLTETLSARLVPVRDRTRLAAELADAEALFAERGWLAEPAAYHRRPLPLDEPELVPGRARGLQFTALTAPSGYEPDPEEPGRDRWLGYVANRTAHAWLLRHPGPERPWLVCVHAYRMGFPLADFLGFPAAWLHRTLGLNVAFPVLPLHGPRRTGWRTGDGSLSGDFLDSLHMGAQAVWDVRRLVHWLRAEGAPAVGVYGLSLGGHTATLLAALEPDLDCVVAGIAPVCYLELARWNVPWPVRAVAERLGFIDEKLARVLRVISPLAMPPRVPRDRRWLYAAMADRLVPRRHTLDLWEHWERPRIAWYPGTHVSFGWEREVRWLLAEAFAAGGLIPRDRPASPAG